MLRLRRATALGLAAACAGGLALAGAVGVPAASADSVRDGQDWALNMMNVPQAWDEGSQGQGMTVAVLDSGVTSDVSDLDGSVVSGPDYTGVDTSSSNLDWGQHGTWMASIIAGHGHGLDDDDGIMGVAPKAKILSVRVIPDRNDPEYSKYEAEQEDSVQDSLAKGITYAVNHGADVISMSIGYSAPSASVRSALQYAYGHGVAVVASSGNSGDTSSASKQGYAPLKFPADYPGVIGVAAVSSTGHVAGFSSNNLSVEVAAPGVNISAQGRDGQYWLVTGTSPACALVAGVAALIKARYPGLAPDLLAKALSSTTHYRPAGGYDQNVGFGTVDAAAALTAAGQLAHQRASSTGTAASHNFGGGPAAVAADPVTPRGSGQLILFAVLAVTALALVAAAVSRLAVLNQLRRREDAQLSAASVPVAGASFGRPPQPAGNPWSQFNHAPPGPAQPGLSRYGAAPAYEAPASFDPSPAFDRSTGQPSQQPGIPQPNQARRPQEPLPTRTPQSPRPGQSPESQRPLPSRTPPPARPRPSFQPHEPLPSRAPQSHPASESLEPSPPRQPQATAASQRPSTPSQPSASQGAPSPSAPSDAQATRPLRLRRESHEPRDPYEPGDLKESRRSEESRGTYGSEEAREAREPGGSEGLEGSHGTRGPDELRETREAQRSRKFGEPYETRGSEPRGVRGPEESRGIGGPKELRGTRGSEDARWIPWPEKSRRTGDSEESHGTRESGEPSQPEKSRDSEGYRAPSGWWHPSDVDD
ncbi:MAG TPA: S8 family serine peptidase [Streptosporangiaceae bacterium]